MFQFLSFVCFVISIISFGERNDNVAIVCALWAILMAVLQINHTIDNKDK